MSKWNLLLVTGIVGLALVGCNAQQNSSTNQTNNQSIEQNGTTTNNEGVEQRKEAPQNVRAYVNQTDAWMVELPSTWNDVHVVENGKMTEFIFPSINAELQQSLFWITAISEDEWKKAQEDGPTGTAKEITRGNGNVYLYYTPLDQVLEGDELKRYEGMIQEIPAIIKSFKFE